jgi:hypothetical protein
LLITASILPRWRTMPASCNSRSTSPSSKPRRARNRSRGTPRGIVALHQDGAPAQAGLEAFELFEQPPIVLHREAPFAVMIGDVLRRGRAPAAPWPSVPPCQTDHFSSSPSSRITSMFFMFH